MKQNDPWRRCLPPAEWPALDRSLWADLTGDGDIFADGASFADLRPTTIRNYCRSYGRWLAFLDALSRLDPTAEPAARATADNVEAYISALRSINASSTVAHRILGLERVLSSMAPDCDWAWLRQAARRLENDASPARDKQARLRSTEALSELGRVLMAEAGNAIGSDPLQRAMNFRDGLALALLAARPLRVANFAGLHFGDHLRRLGDGWVLSLDGHETKTHTPFEVPFPADLVPALEEYIARWRPALRGSRPATPELWLNTRGLGMKPAEMYLAIVKWTESRLGARVNPHLFRDALATDVAINNPAGIRLASVLLGHRQMQTTERFYNQARQREASRCWQAPILQRRRELRRSGKE